MTLVAFPYFGGKARYADEIIRRLPAHEMYVEPFGGAASVLLNKPQSYTEVYNDANSDVVTFFRVLRNCRDELLSWLRNVPYSREEHEKWASQFYGDAEMPDSLDDVVRAGRWFTLRHTQFSAKLGGVSGFSAPGPTNDHASRYQRGVDRLERVAERFRHVTIEHQDWETVFNRYDRESAVQYLDPPYVGNESDYGVAGFNHERIVEALRGAECRWILSYRDLPDGLNSSEFHVATFTATDSADDKGNSKETERLVMNYEPSQTAGFVDDRLSQQRLTEAF